jgi:hypothetical protein
MDEPKFLKAAGIVGARTSLGIDDKTFVGREKQIANMQSAVFGAQTTPLWICGPRRIGKSSLSRRIGACDTLSVVNISCDKFVWNTVDEFIELFCQELSQKLKIKNEKKGRAFVEEFANNTATNHRTAVVLDEFDGVAVNLEQSEQAFFRTLLQDNPFFEIVFISRAKPEQLLQDYSKENSRLLGICEVISVPMLVLKDIQCLLEIVGELCKENIPSWFSVWIYDRVAGYPICVQRLVKEYLVLAHVIGDLPSKEDLEKEEDTLFEAVKDDLFGLWSDIPHKARAVLKDGTAELTKAVKRELKSFNLFVNNSPFRPLWLMEVAEESDQLQVDQGFPLLALAEKLANSIQDCNEIMLRKGSHQVFQITHEVLKLFNVARQVKDTVSLNDRINTLHKICVENTDSDLLDKDDRCLLPKEVRHVYKKSDGFMILVAWRNFCFHDPTQDMSPIESSKRYKTIDEIYCRYLGPERYELTTESDYSLVYQGILSDVVTSVDKLKIALKAIPKVTNG